jgi:tetratricopeptide (TPR) repeat protein
MVGRYLCRKWKLGVGGEHGLIPHADVYIFRILCLEWDKLGKVTICITYQLRTKKGLTFVPSLLAAPGDTNLLFSPTKQPFLARMLTNLKFIYLNQEDLAKALTMVEMILLVFPSAAKEIRDRGLLSFELGKWERAKQDLEFYLAMVPDAGDFDIVQNILGKIA